MLVEIKISIKEAISNSKSITKENMVCLTISNFMFSFRLSFTMDLYSLKPLTAKAKMAGIKIRFCKNMLLKINNNPFDIPIIEMHTDIVYPKQKPR